MCVHFRLVLSLLAFIHLYSTYRRWFTLALPISDPFSVLLHRSFGVCWFLMSAVLFVVVGVHGAGGERCQLCLHL